MSWFRHRETGRVISAGAGTQREGVLRHSPQYEEFSLEQLSSAPPVDRQVTQDRLQGPRDRGQLEQENKAVLLTYAANRGLRDVKSHWTKDEIIQALLEAE